MSSNGIRPTICAGRRQTAHSHGREGLLGERVTTVFFARAIMRPIRRCCGPFRPADLSIDHIGDLLHIDQATVLAAAPPWK